MQDSTSRIIPTWSELNFDCFVYIYMSTNKSNLMLGPAELINHLDSVTTIPLIPFRQEQIDYEAHRKNISYLMRQNTLSEGRPRVICIAGTSLINHISRKQQNELLQVTAEVMAGEGVLLSALIPNPISSLYDQIARQLQQDRPPDAFLIMPIAGVYSSEGLYAECIKLGKYFEDQGAKFLFYHRQSRDQEQVIRIIKDSPSFVGLKVGTQVEDVPTFVREISDDGIVIWGIGDRSTAAAKYGARGHTSGISVIYAKAGDAINNAQRTQQWETALKIETRINALEELRFVNARAFNYSAVLEAMIQSGFNDIDGGEGGPFNPRVPESVIPRILGAISGLEDLH